MTTTVRFDEADERLLDELAATHGGRSNVLRQALRQYAAELDRRQALDEFLADWERESGAVDEDAVAEMARRFDL